MTQEVHRNTLRLAKIFAFSLSRRIHLMISNSGLLCPSAANITYWSKIPAGVLQTPMSHNVRDKRLNIEAYCIKIAKIIPHITVKQASVGEIDFFHVLGSFFVWLITTLHCDAFWSFFIPGCYFEWHSYIFIPNKKFDKNLGQY